MDWDEPHRSVAQAEQALQRLWNHLERYDGDRRTTADYGTMSRTIRTVDAVLDPHAATKRLEPAGLTREL